MRKLILFCIVACTVFGSVQAAINRKALVSRNNVVVTTPDSLSSLSVGNGNFAFTADFTGLQTFPEKYKSGVPLGTQSQWGWHKFSNPNGYKFEETLLTLNFRGRYELYSFPAKGTGRQQEAVDWFRVNPHRLHLGNIGFEIKNKNGNNITAGDLKNTNQVLDLWNAEIRSSFTVDKTPVTVKTVCDPAKDMVAASVNSRLAATGNLAVRFRFPYPTGLFADDACDWTKNDKHQTLIVDKKEQSVVLKRIIDATVYYVNISWVGKAEFKEKEANYFVLQPQSAAFSFTCHFAEKQENVAPANFAATESRSSDYWQNFWKRGGAVDFSACKDPRAKELERRVVLSQYLMAIQSAGDVPPQESGLTYNTWFGKPHLEMHWWHAVHFAMWGRPELMEKSLDWYKKVEPVAKSIAQRQGFEGVRWMKMTDPSGLEAPSVVGSFLIWQQPHYIYMANMAYRLHPTKEVLDKYKDLVFKTADFMASFATYDSVNNRYLLKNIIPAQETLPYQTTYNPPFELSYWHWALETAIEWQKLAGVPVSKQWVEVKNKLSKLAQKDGMYLAAESAPDTYQNVRFTSDHMAVLGAFGVLPQCNLFDPAVMKTTFDWIWKNWNWDKTWGWDYPMTAMSAARLGMPEKAVGALLMDKQTNTYLKNGHNYQDGRLRIYLPGNGGLLTAVAMMCAGWDGTSENNPGFPKDGNWDVKWEGLQKMP